MAVEWTGLGPELLLGLVRDGARPLGAQLQDQLRAAIRTGRLAAGERLPSSRALATELDVSRGLRRRHLRPARGRGVPHDPSGIRHPGCARHRRPRPGRGRRRSVAGEDRDRLRVRRPRSGLVPDARLAVGAGRSRATVADPGAERRDGRWCGPARGRRRVRAPGPRRRRRRRADRDLRRLPPGPQRRPRRARRRRRPHRRPRGPRPGAARRDRTARRPRAGAGTGRRRRCGRRRRGRVGGPGRRADAGPPVPDRCRARAGAAPAAGGVGRVDGRRAGRGRLRRRVPLRPPAGRVPPGLGAGASRVDGIGEQDAGAGSPPGLDRDATAAARRRGGGEAAPRSRGTGARPGGARRPHRVRALRPPPAADAQHLPASSGGPGDGAGRARAGVPA